MWSRGCWDSRCSADSESERCSSASWMTRAPGTAGRWCFTENPASARPLSSTSRLSSETDFKVVRTAGVEGETELPYAALQQLSVPIFDLSAGLPDPQREALSVAFGLDSGHAPNPFLVGLAVLGLLSEAAEDQPVLCVVDDAQWLDRASARALAFIARRLLAERIALLFAARERGEAFGGFPEVHVGPLGRRDARILLESVLPTRVDDRVLERIVAETHGNPLALLELPRGMTPSQLAGGFGLPAAIPLSARIEEHFMRRVANVPPDARRLLLLAAADPTGDLALVSRAADGWGSTRPRRERWDRTACWICAQASSSVTRWRGRLCTAQPRWMSEARCIERSRMPRTRRRTPTAAHGTARRRRRCRTRTSPRSSSVRRCERRRAAGSPRPPRSSSAPRS